MIKKIDHIDDVEMAAILKLALMEDQSPQTWEPPVSDDFMVVQYGYFNGNELCGVILLLRANGVMWDAHIAFKRKAYGMALDTAIFVMSQMFKRDDCLKIKSEIPSNKPHAISLAKRLGFKMIGINERSIMKGGRLLDLTIFTRGA